MKIYIVVSNRSGFLLFKAEDACQAMDIAIGYCIAINRGIPDGLEVHLLDSYLENDEIFDATGCDFIYEE